MKKFLIVAFVFSLFGSICYAQKDMYTENRQIGKFNAISSSSSIDVFITEGNSSTLKVEANYEDLLPRIKTEIKGDELKVSFDGKGRNGFGKTKMKVYVTANNLTSIKTSSSADIHSIGELKAEDIQLSANSSGDITLQLKARDVRMSASSSGDIKLQLTAENVQCEASSSGDIELKGRASSVKANASSSAEIDMKDFIVKTADVSVSSSADVKVYVTDDLKAHASSSGDIKYWGNPKNIDKKQNSSGSIKGY